MLRLAVYLFKVTPWWFQNILKKSLNTNGVKVLDSAANAELLLEMVGEESEKRIYL